ncbi:glucose-6-phosphatase 2 isoform X2 [Eurosta solidaginis]|uniref:glucose-6-phosphatase 2 isoform X2 n=1 Tax=Eurosta solidaginis TaxID=178769 RepID=UPI0035311D27
MRMSKECQGETATRQHSLTSLEPALLFLSEYFTPAKLMDIYVPLLGAFNHHLLVRLVGALGIINVCSSLIKWSVPAYRPYWWIREHNETDLLEQYQGTCETTAAFPSSHCLSLTVFTYLLVFFLLRHFNLFGRHLKDVGNTVVILASTCMVLSRIYLAAQFSHQCILSCIAAIVALRIFDKYSETLYTLTWFKSVSVVFGMSIFPVIIYFGMLQLDLDPHWSVRMAFKWCSDPAQLRHEDSSIFVLGRDFGYIMGVVLSTPIYKCYKTKSNPAKRLPAVLVLEVLNYYVRLVTPKNYGRVAFVAYEYVRNIIHSFTLLTILPNVSG